VLARGGIHGRRPRRPVSGVAPVAAGYESYRGRCAYRFTGRPNARFLPPRSAGHRPRWCRTSCRPSATRTMALTQPPVRVDDRLVVAGEARYGERAHAVGRACCPASSARRVRWWDRRCSRPARLQRHRAERLSAPVKSPIGLPRLAFRATSRSVNPGNFGRWKRLVMNRRIEVVSYWV
jgi:hypothetical protein